MVYDLPPASSHSNLINNYLQHVCWFMSHPKTYEVVYDVWTESEELTVLFFYSCHTSWGMFGLQCVMWTQKALAFNHVRRKMWTKLQCVIWIKMPFDSCHSSWRIHWLQCVKWIQKASAFELCDTKDNFGIVYRV